MSNVPDNYSPVNGAWTSAVERYNHLSCDLSVEAALAWLYSGAGRVSFTKHSRDSNRSAVSSIVEILERGDIPVDAECLADVRVFHDNIESIYYRVLREKPHLKQPASYRTRPLLLFSEFLLWAESPNKYRPRKSTRIKTRRGNTHKASPEQKRHLVVEPTVDETAEPPALEVEPPVLEVEVPAPTPAVPINSVTRQMAMPLPGGRVFSYSLPADLSRADVDRIRIQLLLGVEVQGLLKAATSWVDNTAEQT